MTVPISKPAPRRLPDDGACHRLGRAPGGAGMSPLMSDVPGAAFFLATNTE
jgi:hypothetical protein